MKFDFQPQLARGGGLGGGEEEDNSVNSRSKQLHSLQELRY